MLTADSITRQVDKTDDEAVKVILADILPVMGVVGLIWNVPKRIHWWLLMLTTTLRWKSTHSKLSLLKKLKLASYWLVNGKKDENSESSKLQFSMTTDAAPNVNKRFTALNFIISVQYSIKDKIYSQHSTKQYRYLFCTALIL